MPSPFILDLARECGAETGTWVKFHTESALAAFVERIREDALSEARKHIASNAWAVSFQTMGQYRTALLEVVDAIREGAK